MEVRHQISGVWEPNSRTHCAGRRGLRIAILILVLLPLLAHRVLAQNDTLDVVGDLPSTDLPPSSDINLTQLFPKTTFYKALYPIWSPNHAEVSRDLQSVKLKLDWFSGCAIKSLQKFYHGFFSASIKLPGNYSAGVVSTFYLSNNEAYPKNHDEIDFEFLGTVPEEPYTIQTNIYGNGVTHIGREQRFRLWFDPTESFHNYSVLWTANHTVFFVDDTPVWEYPRLPDVGTQYPSKQMSLYVTIWDASRWATDGGRYRVNYSYQPFIATYSNFIISECPIIDPSGPEETARNLCSYTDNSTIPPHLTDKQRQALKWVKLNHRLYSYCEDVERYPDLSDIPECAAERAEMSRSKIHRRLHQEGYPTARMPKMDTNEGNKASQRVP